MVAASRSIRTFSCSSFFLFLASSSLNNFSLVICSSSSGMSWSVKTRGSNIFQDFCQNYPTLDFGIDKVGWVFRLVKDSALSIWSKGSEGTNCDIFSIIMISNFPCHGACIDNLSLLKDRPDSHWCPDSLRQYLWPLLSCCWQPDPQAESPGGRRISERAGHWSEYQAVHYGLYFCLRLTRTRRSMLAVWRQGWDWLKVTRSVRYELRSSDRSWLEPVS